MAIMLAHPGNQQITVKIYIYGNISSAKGFQVCTARLAIYILQPDRTCGLVTSQQTALTQPGPKPTMASHRAIKEQQHIDGVIPGHFPPVSTFTMLDCKHTMQ